MLRIAFAGAHSTGKTTLCNRISKDLNIQNVINLTRNVPKELRGTKKGQELILTNYLYNVSMLEGDYIVDRSPIDCIAYSICANLNWDSAMIDGILSFYKKSEFFPTHIVYLPIEFDLIQDGDRPDDKLRHKVDFCIREILYSRFKKEFYTISGSVEGRLSKIYDIIGR